MFINYILIWGSRLYGKVDRVADLFHVATKFGHLWYIPLLPLGSWVVLGESGKDWRGVKIPLSGKSVLMAWLRAGLILGGIALLVGGVVGLGGRTPVHAAVALVTGLACIGGFAATKLVPTLSRASYERAKQLAELVGLNAAGRLTIEEAYGRVSAEEASQVREAMNAAARQQAAARQAAQQAARDARADNEGAGSAAAGVASAPSGDPNLAALEAMGMVPPGASQSD